MFIIVRRRDDLAGLAASPSPYVHDTLAEAQVEAERLAQLHKGNEYLIFEHPDTPDYTMKVVPKYAEVFN